MWQGGVIPIGTVSTAMTGVMRESNRQALLRLVVKLSSSLAGPHQISGQEHEKLLGQLAEVAALGLKWVWLECQERKSSSQRLFSTVKNLDPGCIRGHGA